MLSEDLPKYILLDFYFKTKQDFLFKEVVFKFFEMNCATYPIEPCAVAGVGGARQLRVPRAQLGGVRFGERGAAHRLRVRNSAEASVACSASTSVSTQQPRSSSSTQPKVMRCHSHCVSRSSSNSASSSVAPKLITFCYS